MNYINLSVGQVMPILFVFGVPKSGTTYLQMLLDSHPEISCPSEHQLAALIEPLSAVLENYNHRLIGVDQKTGCQGPRLFTGADLDELFVTAVHLAARRGADGKAVCWMAINDNGVPQRLAAFHSLFPEARFVHLVRDPRAIAVSSWHHNQRVEEGFLARAGDMVSWAREVGNTWRLTVEAVRAQEPDMQGGMYTLRYEDLRCDPVATLAALLDFLGGRAGNR